MYRAKEEQNHLAKYIKEFENKKKPPYNSNLRKVKEEVLNSAMALLKEREIMLRAFQRRIFSLLKPSQSEESEESKQSSNHDKYTSSNLVNYSSTSSNAPHTSFSSDSDIPLFTPNKRNRTQNINS